MSGKDVTLVAAGALRSVLRREWAIVHTMKVAERAGNIKQPNPEYWAAKGRLLIRLNEVLDQVEAEINRTTDGAGDADRAG